MTIKESHSHLTHFFMGRITPGTGVNEYNFVNDLLHLLIRNEVIVKTANETDPEKIVFHFSDESVLVMSPTKEGTKVTSFFPNEYKPNVQQNRH